MDERVHAILVAILQQGELVCAAGASLGDVLVGGHLVAAHNDGCLSVWKDLVGGVPSGRKQRWRGFLYPVAGFIRVAGCERPNL